MIVEYLRYEIPQDLREAFIEAYRQAAGPLSASPYCLGFDLARCVDAPDTFIVRIEWTSAEDHLQRFRGSPAFRDFLPLVRPFIPNMPEMRHYEPIAAHRFER